MKTIALIPTYNEAGNIETLITDILTLPVDIEVLVVDDSSPDKTYEIVNNLSLKNKRIHLLLRKENRGRGWAGIEGFKKALDLGADFVVEMDGDGSHAPRFIPSFLKLITGADIIIGSRYVKGGKDEKRGILRQVISNFARIYLKIVLGIKANDPTSGFRLFSRKSLEMIIPHLKARDPFIVTEVMFFAKQHNLSIMESPIEFMPRGQGESKLKALTLFKYLLRALKLRTTL